MGHEVNLLEIAVDGCELAHEVQLERLLAAAGERCCDIGIGSCLEQQPVAQILVAEIAARCWERREPLKRLPRGAERTRTLGLGTDRDMRASRT